MAEFQSSIMISRYYLLGVNELQVCKNLWVDPKTENITIISISGDLSYSEAEVFEAGGQFVFHQVY